MQQIGLTTPLLYLMEEPFPGHHLFSLLYAVNLELQKGGRIGGAFVRDSLLKAWLPRSDRRYGWRWNEIKLVAASYGKQSCSGFSWPSASCRGTQIMILPSELHWATCDSLCLTYSNI